MREVGAFEAKNKTTPGINFVSDVANCVPPGVPGSMQQPYPLEFLFTPDRVTCTPPDGSFAKRSTTAGVGVHRVLICGVTFDWLIR